MEKFPEGNQKGWQKGRVRGFGFKCGRGVRQDGFQCSLTQKSSNLDKIKKFFHKTTSPIFVVGDQL